MYKINVIAHMLKDQRVARFGELVHEKQLNGNGKDLEDKGYVKKATDAEIKAWKKKQSNSDDDAGDIDLTKPISQMNKSELEAKAAELGVDLSKATNNTKRKEAIEEHLAALEKDKKAKEEREKLLAAAKEKEIEGAEEMSNEEIQAALDSSDED